jgi:putative nucleotide binding protein
LIDSVNRRNYQNSFNSIDKERSRRFFEEFAYVLDYLPHGRQSARFVTGPIVQVVGEAYFTLLEVELKTGTTVSTNERTYIGKGKREKVNRIVGRINFEGLTESAKVELSSVLEELIANREKVFIDFFNNTQAVTPRMHSLELLPGVGKKLMWQILDEREKRLFDSFSDLQERTGLADVIKVISKRIVEELSEESKYQLFTRMS